MPDNHYFEYGEEELAWLRSRDRALGAAIDRIGRIRRGVTPDLFMALVNSIVGQQISTKAQVTIWARIQARLAPITPENIAAIPVEDLQSCGISFRKAAYIKEAAQSIVRGELNLDHLHALPDDEVCKRLSLCKGIGTWTAEMLMTFSMRRPDVISRDDLAIIRGLRMLYRHRAITPELFARYRRRYSPYASVASLYLWAIAGGACPELTDPAQKPSAAKKSAAGKKAQPKA